MRTHQYQYPHAGTRTCYVHMHIVHSVNNVPCTPSVFFRPCTCSCAICANVIASRRTCQVGGWRPCPPLHLVRPACTVPSSSRGWLLKQVSIVSVTSPTPSRTALPFVAAFLLTYSLKSLRWSGWSAEKAQHFTAHSSQVTELTNSPDTFWNNTGLFHCQHWRLRCVKYLREITCERVGLNEHTSHQVTAYSDSGKL